MSTEWDVFCLDCDTAMDGDGLPEWRLEESVQSIVDNRNRLVALSDLISQCAWVDVFVDGKKIDLVWLYKHVDHKLRARNEYGVFGAGGAS